MKHPFRKALAVLVLLFAALCVPPVFRGFAWLLLHEEALRQGGMLRVQNLEGSLWEPLVLDGVRGAVFSSEGGRLTLEAERVEFHFSWWALLPNRSNRRVLESLVVRRGKVLWALPAEGAVGGTAEGKRSWFLTSLGGPMPFPMPSKWDLELLVAEVQSPGVSFKAEQTRALVSEVSAGKISASRLEVRVQGWSKVFRDVRGQTALQSGRLQLGQLGLMEGLAVELITFGESAVSPGMLDVEADIRAFGGEIRAQGQIAPRSEREPLDASGTFSHLGVAPLAAFLGVTDAAGGFLETGKFSFRGQPGHPELATASLRLEARNFQWETRQWDSLLIGATLLDRRIQVPEFSLRQGHNQLVLNGDVQWPGGGQPWWKADFGVNVTAQINNLTELSALLLPEFKYAAGALKVDGAVRSQAGVLGGALIVTGSRLTWRSAPIDELVAAVKLDGAEVQVLNAELARGSDFVRGKGSVRIGERWSYKGELRGTVGDLRKYSALFQPPLAPEPYSGGVQFEWSGGGSGAGNEGRLQANFHALQPVSTPVFWPVPLSGSVSGNYSPSGIEVNDLEIGDERVSLRTQISLASEGLHFTGVKLLQGNQTALEGELLLPVAVLQNWPSVDWSGLLDSKSSLQANLRLKELDLSGLSRLPGVASPLSGTVSGDCKLSGTPRDLGGEGQLKLRKVSFAYAGGRLSELDADLNWKDKVLQAPRLGWRSASGRYEGKLAIDWKNQTEGPQLDAAVRCEDAAWTQIGGLRFSVAPADQPGAAPAMIPLSARGKSSWTVSGDLDAPLLTGELLVTEVNFGGVPDLRFFWREAEFPKRLVYASELPWVKDFKLQLKIGSGDGASVTGTAGAVRVDLSASGTAGAPVLSGEVRAALRGSAAGAVLEVEPWVMHFAPGAEPEVEIRSRGLRGQAAFSATAVGPLSRPVREYQADEPLNAETVRAVFEENKAW